jgi:hypothetical protein
MIKKQEKITIYLLLGLNFAILNLNYLNFGSLLSKTDYYSYNSLLVITSLDKISFFILDIIAWPLILFRNIFLYFPIVILILVVGFLVFCVFDKFKGI